jgi:hypothetical protein
MLWRVCVLFGRLLSNQRQQPNKWCIVPVKHLRSSDDGLARDVTLGDHHLLGDGNLFEGNLDTEITTGNHNSVTLLKNLIEVLQTLLVLDLLRGMSFSTPAQLSRRRNDSIM